MSKIKPTIIFKLVIITLKKSEGMIIQWWFWNMLFLIQVYTILKSNIESHLLIIRESSDHLAYKLELLKKVISTYFILQLPKIISNINVMTSLFTRMWMGKTLKESNQKWEQFKNNRSLKWTFVKVNAGSNGNFALVKY